MIDVLIVTVLALLGVVIVWAVRRRSSITGYVNPDGSGRGNWFEDSDES